LPRPRPPAAHPRRSAGDRRPRDRVACSMNGPPEPSDEAMLDALQRRSFGYFVDHTNPRNGLVADTTRAGSPSSIAVIGFALSVYPVGVERGWIERGDAVQRTLAALRFLMGSDQSGTPGATGHRGFY